VRLYGTVEYVPREGIGGGRAMFLVRCEPHVSMKLKQVFARVSPQMGTIKIAVTEDTARDLEWFLDRYPMQVAADAARVLAGEARAYDRRRERTREAMLGQVPKMPGRTLALPARSYQEQAAALAFASGALLLADDLGVGKTVAAIRMLAYDGALPAVVVTLTHLTRQWARELARFLPGLRVHIAKKGTPYDMRPKVRGQHVGEGPEVVVINYHKAAGWSEHLAGWARSVVFDEAQELRRSGTAKYNGCRHMVEHANLVMGLSGTPIYGYGDEWFNVLDALKPGFLGTRDEFLREWCTLVKGQGEDAKYKITNPAAFGGYLYESGLMLRRRRRDVGQELPPCQKIWHEVDHDAAVLEQGEGDAAELARGILGLREVDPLAIRNMSAEFANRMRQATGLAKAPFVADFVRMLVESGEKVALFGWHRSVYDCWRERLKGIEVAWYTGEESPTQKEASFKAFRYGDAQVLVMSLRSGAGLDGLQQVCSVVVLGELDWSPQVMDQCIGRVDRDGQANKVVAYYLTAADGADPTMLEVAGIKRAQLVAVRDPGHAFVEEANLDPDHVRKLAEAFLSKHKVKPGPAGPVSPP